MDNNGIRINKFLSEAGVCSRREADRKIENKEVTINDRVDHKIKYIFYEGNRG